MENRFTRLAQDISEEMTAEGKALPVPPDAESDSLDREFWMRFDARLADADA
ncbi:MAG TPA: hypothetical protein VIL92_13815 [Gaiellaceae bacterium]